MRLLGICTTVSDHAKDVMPQALEALVERWCIDESLATVPLACAFVTVIVIRYMPRAICTLTRSAR